jgi:DNA-binding CsgD family transcriptional regulator
MQSTGESIVVGPIIPSLVRWGTSPDADLVYRTVVSRGPRNAGDIARDVGLSKDRVTAALDELAALDAVSPRGDEARRPRVWSPRRPAEVAARLRHRHLRRSAGSRRNPRELPVVVRSLVGGALELGDGLRHLPSRPLTRARLRELVAVARHEHLALNPEPVFESASARAAAPMDRMLLDRGVAMRVVGVQPAAVDPMMAYGRRPTDRVPEYREASAVPLKLIVVDRKVALFPVSPDDPDRGYLEVSQAPLVGALVAAFEREWRDAESPMASSEAPLTNRERALIALLARGLTDDAAARRLGISARTVSNILRGLMDRLGADNRFQLGLALGARYAVLPTTPDRHGPDEQGPDEQGPAEHGPDEQEPDAQGHNAQHPETRQEDR